MSISLLKVDVGFPKIVGEEPSGTTVTSTTAITKSQTVLILANRLTTNSVLEMIWTITKNSGTAGTMQAFVYTNSSDTLVGATLIATGTLVGATIRTVRHFRDIAKESNAGTIFQTSVAAVGDSFGTAAQSSITLNNSSAIYIIFAVQNASTADVSVIEKIRITEIS